MLTRNWKGLTALAAFTVCLLYPLGLVNLAAWAVASSPVIATFGAYTTAVALTIVATTVGLATYLAASAVEATLDGISWINRKLFSNNKAPSSAPKEGHRASAEPPARASNRYDAPFHWEPLPGQRGTSPLNFFPNPAEDADEDTAANTTLGAAAASAPGIGGSYPTRP